MIGDVKCPECGAMDSKVEQSTVAGLAKCIECGAVFPLPEELIRHMFDAKDEPEGPTRAELVVPDKIECELGWRAWVVTQDYDDLHPPILYSPSGHAGSFWTPGQAMVATCAKTIHKGGPDGTIVTSHDPPDKNCRCGLYSAKTKEHMLSQSYHRYDVNADGLFKVIGKVKLWGRVLEGSLGWRAGFGYPEELYVPYEAGPRLLEALEKTYECPVMFGQWQEEPVTRLAPEQLKAQMNKDKEEG